MPTTFIHSAEKLEPKVKEVREAFFNTYSENISNGVYHESDLDRVRQRDDFLRSYIRHQKLDVTKAAEMMNTSFKFRKEMELNDLTESSFPREMHEMGAVFYHNEDKEGQRLLIFQTAKYKKPPDAVLQHKSKQFVCWWLDKHWLQEPEERIVIFYDMTGAGLANMDMENTKFHIACFGTFYPALLAYMLILDMPWVLSAVWKIIKQLLSSEQQKYVLMVKKADLIKHIDKDHLLVHMGGTDTFQYQYIPSEDSGIDIPNGDLAGLTDSVASTASNASSTSNNVRKRVTFADKDETLYTSIDTDSIEEKTTGGKAQLNHTKTSKRKIKDDNMFVGDIGAISPAEHFLFVPAEDAKESLDVLSIMNSSQNKLAFKVKTTSPDGYRVRPSTGLLKPNSSTEVNIFLQNGHLSGVERDKFLVMLMSVDESVASANQVADQWKRQSRDPAVYMEHRLWCKVEGGPNATKSGKDAADPTQTQLASLSTQVGEMLQIQQQLQDSIHKLMWGTALMLILLILITCVASAAIYIDWTPHDSTSAASSCAQSMSDALL